MKQRILYIGQYTNGTTSRMRCETLQSLFNTSVFEVIDTHVPFYKTNKLVRSFGFRYKVGPLIKRINSYIKQSMKHKTYDVIWVDKAVFITPKTTALLKSRTNRLVHFTPDPAFTFHQSKFFFKSLTYYDYVVTTKSYELATYKKHVSATHVLYATQGFDKRLHQVSGLDFKTKKGLVFIGHFEAARAHIIEQLLNAKIDITIAGIKWQSFAKKHKENACLTYLGDGVYGADYVTVLQNAKIAWGAISKWIPELHTTRTFEIPACGTALLTERNKEITTFFNEDEVIFYDNDAELVAQVKYYMANDAPLKAVTLKGHTKVTEAGYDYASILSNLLNNILR